MTVSELITILQARKFKGNMRIVTGGFDEFELTDVTTVEVIRVKLSDTDGVHIAQDSSRWDAKDEEFRKPHGSELTEVVEINF